MVDGASIISSSESEAGDDEELASLPVRGDGFLVDLWRVLMRSATAETTAAFLPPARDLMTLLLPCRAGSSANVVPAISSPTTNALLVRMSAAMIISAASDSIAPMVETSVSGDAVSRPRFTWPLSSEGAPR